MGGSMVINIFLAGSLSLLWGLINALQFVTHFPFLNVTFPVFAKCWYNALLQIANFSVLPTDKIKKALEDVIGDADLNDRNFDVESVLSETTI